MSSRKATSKHDVAATDAFLMVLAIAFLAGMSVALGIYFWWRSDPSAFASHAALRALALATCPPFVLAGVVGPGPEAGLTLVLMVGTIIFANGFLYAGVAAGGYFLFTLNRRARRQNS
jgi:hypothetical protein